MTFAGRFAAATMALVLALFPVALQRCRTACVSGATTVQVNTGGHACHDIAADESVTRMDPMARACGHSGEARTFESAGLVTGKIRTMVPLEAIQTLPGGVHPPQTLQTDRPPVRSALPRVVLALDLPLRL